MVIVDKILFITLNNRIIIILYIFVTNKIYIQNARVKILNSNGSVLNIIEHMQFLNLRELI